MNLDAVKFDEKGLVPVVVRNSVTGTVAMLAWANRDALARTLASRQATFWSRSRNTIWVKGETSGNRMEVLSVSAVKAGTLHPLPAGITSGFGALEARQTLAVPSAPPATPGTRPASIRRSKALRAGRPRISTSRPSSRS